MLAYLFHRIGDRLDGRPTLLIIDEGWLALDDEGFAGQLREWFKTLRKKNASVIFATQSLQAGVVGNIEANRAEMSELVGRSQGATGTLRATQAGNQLLALQSQSQQLSDLIALMAADGRAEVLSEAERATAAEQGRIQRERFLTPGTGYQPGNAQMFN